VITQLLANFKTKGETMKYYQPPLICEVCGKEVAYSISSFWVLESVCLDEPERYAISCISCENIAAKFVIMRLVGMAQPKLQLEGVRLESHPLALGDGNP
jgi:hypothetical protein